MPFPDEPRKPARWPRRRAFAPSPVDDLIEDFGTADERTRCEIVKRLAAAGHSDPRIIPILITVLLGDPDAAVRTTVARLLREEDDRRVIEALRLAGFRGPDVDE